MKTSDEQIRRLTEAAKAACSNAYCRYSGFAVGAALLTADDRVYSGCNVENASYGLSMCAERNTLFGARAARGDELDVHALLIYTPTQVPTTPCGACRQVIQELAPRAEIIMVCDGPEVVRKDIGELLPDAFTFSVLMPA